MADKNKSNLQWLAIAMTVPENAEEHYFFDAITELFFYCKHISGNTIALYNFLDYPLSERDYNDIIVRLEHKDDEDHIVEIPRLSVRDKIDIQMRFLSALKGVNDLKKLTDGVEHQNDDYKMVLDTLLVETGAGGAMLVCWDEFKLKAIDGYITRYAYSSLNQFIHGDFNI